MKHVLFIDDDKNIRAAWKRAFAGTDIKAYIVSSAEEALCALAEIQFDLVVTDYQMPYMNGVQFCSIVQQNYPQLPRILLSGHLSLKIAAEALNKGGIVRLLQKPIPIVGLHHEIFEALKDVPNAKILSVRDKLEREYPGITEVQRDAQGKIIVDL